MFAEQGHRDYAPLLPSPKGATSTPEEVGEYWKHVARIYSRQVRDYIEILQNVADRAGIHARVCKANRMQLHAISNAVMERILPLPNAAVPPAAAAAPPAAAAAPSPAAVPAPRTALSNISTAAPLHNAASTALPAVTSPVRGAACNPAHTPTAAGFYTDSSAAVSARPPLCTLTPPAVPAAPAAYTHPLPQAPSPSTAQPSLATGPQHGTAQHAYPPAAVQFDAARTSPSAAGQAHAQPPAGACDPSHPAARLNTSPGRHITAQHLLAISPPQHGQYESGYLEMCLATPPSARPPSFLYPRGPSSPPAAPRAVPRSLSEAPCARVVHSDRFFPSADAATSPPVLAAVPEVYAATGQDGAAQRVPAQTALERRGASAEAQHAVHSALDPTSGTPLTTTAAAAVALHTHTSPPPPASQQPHTAAHNAGCANSPTAAAQPQYAPNHAPNNPQCSAPNNQFPGPMQPYDAACSPPRLNWAPGLLETCLATPPSQRPPGNDSQGPANWPGNSERVPAHHADHCPWMHSSPPVAVHSSPAHCPLLLYNNNASNPAAQLALELRNTPTHQCLQRYHSSDAPCDNPCASHRSQPPDPCFAPAVPSSSGLLPTRSPPLQQPCAPSQHPVSQVSLSLALPSHALAPAAPHSLPARSNTPNNVNTSRPDNVNRSGPTARAAAQQSSLPPQLDTQQPLVASLAPLPAQSTPADTALDAAKDTVPHVMPRAPVAHVSPAALAAQFARSDAAPGAVEPAPRGMQRAGPHSSSSSGRYNAELPLESEAPLFAALSCAPPYVESCWAANAAAFAAADIPAADVPAAGAVSERSQLPPAAPASAVISQGDTDRLLRGPIPVARSQPALPSFGPAAAPILSQGDISQGDTDRLLRGPILAPRSQHAPSSVPDAATPSSGAFLSQRSVREAGNAAPCPAAGIAACECVDAIVSQGDTARLLRGPIPVDPAGAAVQAAGVLVSQGDTDRLLRGPVPAEPASSAEPASHAEPARHAAPAISAEPAQPSAAVQAVASSSDTGETDLLLRGPIMPARAQALAERDDASSSRPLHGRGSGDADRMLHGVGARVLPAHGSTAIASANTASAATSGAAATSAAAASAAVASAAAASAFPRAGAAAVRGTGSGSGVTSGRAPGWRALLDNAMAGCAAPRATPHNATAVTAIAASNAALERPAAAFQLGANALQPGGVNALQQGVVNTQQRGVNAQSRGVNVQAGGDATGGVWMQRGGARKGNPNAARQGNQPAAGDSHVGGQGGVEGRFGDGTGQVPRNDSSVHDCAQPEQQHTLSSLPQCPSAAAAAAAGGRTDNAPAGNARAPATPNKLGGTEWRFRAAAKPVPKVAAAKAATKDAASKSATKAVRRASRPRSSTRDASATPASRAPYATSPVTRTVTAAADTAAAAAPRPRSRNARLPAAQTTPAGAVTGDHAARESPRVTAPQVCVFDKAGLALGLATPPKRSRSRQARTGRAAARRTASPVATGPHGGAGVDAGAGGVDAGAESEVHSEWGEAPAPGVTALPGDPGYVDFAALTPGWDDSAAQSQTDAVPRPHQSPRAVNPHASAVLPFAQRFGDRESSQAAPRFVAPPLLQLPVAANVLSAAEHAALGSAAFVHVVHTTSPGATALKNRGGAAPARACSSPPALLPQRNPNNARAGPADDPFNGAFPGAHAAPSVYRRIVPDSQEVRAGTGEPGGTGNGGQVGDPFNGGFNGARGSTAAAVAAPVNRRVTLPESRSVQEARAGAGAGESGGPGNGVQEGHESGKKRASLPPGRGWQKRRAVATTLFVRSFFFLIFY